MSNASRRVVLLDSGGANLGSVQAAFARLGVDAPVSSDPAVIAEATHLVLPGVGAAASAMARLRENGLDKLIPTTTQPLLGICIGMQLLYEGSEEGDTECLGLLPGRVRKLVPSPGVRIPHMGWNQLQAGGAHPLVQGLDGENVYFVHSYAAPTDDNTLASCDHGQQFAAVVSRGRVSGAQFHPERSSTAGARLLANFLAVPV
ncbi:imidazole glycerol phosphate synthase subunit HisH [soil metagenome]